MQGTETMKELKIAFFVRSAVQNQRLIELQKGKSAWPLPPRGSKVLVSVN